MNVIKVVKESKEKPKVLVVTPLLYNHKISKQTKVSIQRNNIPFIWLSSEGKFNIPTNADFAINWYKNNYGDLPPYYLMIDRDIILGRHMIDKLVGILSRSPDMVAYTYASFEFKGYINQQFPARPFDINALLQHNYISSNSLFKTKIIEKIGLVKDNEFKRLLDWAFLLKLFYHGYVGIPVPHANFVANSTPDDISAGSAEDYRTKRTRVLEKFGKPIVEKYSKTKNTVKIKNKFNPTKLNDLNL